MLGNKYIMASGRQGDPNEFRLMIYYWFTFCLTNWFCAGIVATLNDAVAETKNILLNVSLAN